ncbi:sensor histidine kinase [Paenibacillus sepulcri]|uniref:histidine kinase n=1 Tax=Paenibacillus sepulcri TaxID=359917 RepID=A0ABS7C569_9BACL|nr:HAMP domain-containing histidine kinase [Paenibacillus sepulcri]
MSFEKELAYLFEQKEKLFSNWFASIHENCPDFYSFSDLHTQVNLFFQFSTELEHPIENHALFDTIPEWCRKSIHEDLPISHVLISSHCWRNAIIEILYTYDGSNAALELIILLLTRQDAFDKKVSEEFWQLSKKIITDKDAKINEIHEDRIQLIGKMASSMAHEIRNPLTAIRGFLKLIRSNISTEISNKIGHYIGIIENEFESINMQITGFLSFSRNRKIEEEMMDFPVSAVVATTLSLLNPRIISEDISFTTSYEKDFIFNVQKTAIQQVLSNIINNAIDALFAIEQGKEISIVCSEDADHFYMIIWNNGPEIPEKMKSEMFLPFVTNKEYGTGLGLAICKEIMLRNNGDIMFSSTEFETTFTLSFQKPL